ncbi:hypothetical protein MOQ72_42645 [Saccharopolyspora sp. K220]|uniref:zinc finger domain-containing protein n=1 Tax=Saccharopolyspora soli TaxID=2926618 RepID=UPI001F5A48CD|nr:hypothetical protein [Saccharopolyspora soli]MCI2424115.1 hypothetical protein [Saccharopolyspora soli]
MNAQEVAQLLGYASTLDPKISADSALQVRAWAQLLDDIPVHLARDAIQDQLPSIIRNGHASRHRRLLAPARRDAAEAKHNAELRARNRRPLDIRQLCAIRSGVGRVTAALAVARGADPEHAEADAHARRAFLAVPCPHCKARPGSRCTGPSGRPLTRTPAHPSRLDTAVTNTQRRPADVWRSTGRQRACAHARKTDSEVP